ncbi:hypothetical protein [Gaetbulibacter aestuarii]|uniref:Lipocalin-like domain-containing protein n=1 Tax=Gaetbulibacter aestuarii TaxID=1502358 RepID=A0ABW7MXH9_9FLAO
MNKFFWVTVITVLSIVLVSCSKDSNQQELNTLDGVWQLTAWNVEGGMDMNKDGVAHTNILDEISCTNNETLVFDASGVVLFNNTFNPKIKITAINNLLENLSTNVVCDSGVIGSATSYTVDGNKVILGSTIAIINGNEIDIIRKDKLKVFNPDMSTVIVTQDVMEVYTKI